MKPSRRTHLHAVDQRLEPLAISDESVTVKVSGDLHAATAGELRMHFLSLAGNSGPAEIIVDLSAVGAVDHAGIAPLLEASQIQLLRGALFSLHAISLPVSQFLRSHPSIAATLTPPSAPLHHGPPDHPVAAEPITEPVISWFAPPLPPRPDDDPSAPALPQTGEAQNAARAENEHLRQALLTRDVIGQAKGIISLLCVCDETIAFAVLTRISQDTNRKLRDVAALIARSAAHGTQLPSDIAIHFSAIRPLPITQSRSGQPTEP